MDHRTLLTTGFLLLCGAVFLHSLNSANALPHGPTVSLGSNPIVSVAGSGSNSALLTVPTDSALIITDIELTNSNAYGGDTIRLQDTNGTVYGEWYLHHRSSPSCLIVISKASGIYIPAGTQLSLASASTVNYNFSGYYAHQ